jgi:hypothetical protein
LYEKVIFGQKDVQSFFKVMPLACLISFAPNYKNKNKNVWNEKFKKKKKINAFCHHDTSIK